MRDQQWLWLLSQGWHRGFQQRGWQMDSGQSGQRRKTPAQRAETLGVPIAGAGNLNIFRHRAVADKVPGQSRRYQCGKFHPHPNW